MVLSLVLCTASATFSQSYEERLKSIQSEVREKQHALSTSSDNLDQLQYQLGQHARKLNEAKLNLEKADESLAVSKSKLADLNKQADALSRQHTSHLSLLAAGMRSMQHDARTHRFNYLLSADDWSNFERRAVYYGYFSRERENKLSQLAKQLSRMSDIRMAIGEQNRMLALKREEQQKILQKIEHERQEKQGVIKLLETKVAQEQRAIATLKKDAAELRRIIEQMASSDASSLKFYTRKGRLPWPLDRPVISRSDNEKLPGIFLTADANTEVKSIYDGYVVFSDWFRSYGMLLIIDHGDGYMSLYANNEVLYKDVGDTVLSGERIAEVGNGGTSNNTGLYFEIRKFNQQLNPKLWCYSQNI